jgi:hypothetical protein
LLAVVTFMALTFLAVSRRERGAVTTTTDTASAKLAADDALASAEAQIVANVLATTNPYNFDLLVSTNYINPVGFQTGVSSFTNVNYYYPIPGGGPVAGNDFLQLLANLYYLPRPPVFVPTNTTGPLDFRFYLDLNRNGQAETNGLVGNFVPNGPGQVKFDGTTSFQVGDPEWIGVLQHPDQPHGPNNPFVARYAFAAVPIGNTLDLNAIHNQVFDENNADPTVNPAANLPANVGKDFFFRNQGVGSWEINLAAFLADLNTNEWGQIVGSGANPPAGSVRWYQYVQPTSPNQGAAFDDARALQAYRYNNNYLSLASVDNMFDPPFGGPVGPGDSAFRNDNIDGYSDGSLQTGFQLPGDTTAPPNDAPSLPWAGADNTNHFFDLQELFNTSETAQGVPAGQVALGNDFTGRLLNANTNVSTYNRYTFYRLLSQMGVESLPAQDRINLNYTNAAAYFNNRGVVTNIAVIPDALTNFGPWKPLQFFTIAADRMLHAYSQEWLVESPSNYLATYGMTTNIGTVLNPTNIPVPFGITNIPVWVNNQFVYTPAVQRVLQLAANIYDSVYYYSNNFVSGGVNSAGVAYPSAYLPNVFRPFFNAVPMPPLPATPLYTNVYIGGFTIVTNVNRFDLLAGWPLTAPYNLDNPVDLNKLRFINLGPNYINVFGVPWIIGAKKGFPNFNEFAMESVFQLTRKLQITRPSTNSPISDYQYNQMFNLSLTNQLGVECWNSYTNDYNRPVDIYVTNYLSVTLTNDENFNINLTFFPPISPISGFLPIPNTAINAWPGYNPAVNPITAPLSFQIPLDTNVAVIPTTTYRFNGSAPFLTTNLALPFETGVDINGDQYPQPHWWLMTTNNLQVVMVDHASGGIIDYVQLRGPNTVRDLTSEIISQYDTAAGPDGNDMWNTNIQSGVPSGPIGLISQIGVSIGNYTAGAGSGAWNSTSQTEKENEIDGFRAFWGLGLLYPGNPGEPEAVAQATMTNFIQAPYTPTATVVQHFSWQANDPLVHYTASDLNWAGASQLNRTADDLTNEDLGQLNQRYMPWGGNPILSGADPYPYNLALKDPLVWQSDDWDFPTYRFPTVGWLGRVHRGTPWQTVYLKSPDILEQTNASGVFIGTNTWVTWTGDALFITNAGQYYDAVNTAPTQDRLLFDTFTTAFNDNATRGQLSVNVDAGNPSPQAGLAAWSALFSGVIALSNNAADPFMAPPIVQHNGSLINFTAFPIDPAGPGGVGSAMGQAVVGINQTRTTFTNVDGLVVTFEHVGDVLAVPQLTYQSPFLNLFTNGVVDGTQLQNGISDEMYEWLPQQVMSLLRVSGTPQSPVRYVIYCYGQALKPAPNGIYTGGGAAFGMVTNYQIVSESATRWVVRFGSVRTNIITAAPTTTDAFGNLITNWVNVPMITNNNVVIESHDVLPAN